MNRENVIGDGRYRANGSASPGFQLGLMNVSLHVRGYAMRGSRHGDGVNVRWVDVHCKLEHGKGLVRQLVQV